MIFIYNAMQNQVTNTSRNLNKSKYAYRASQIPVSTPLAKPISRQFKQFFQNRKEKYFAERDTHFSEPNYLPIRGHSAKVFKSHHPKIIISAFCSDQSRNQSHKPQFKSHWYFTNILFAEFESLTPNAPRFYP